MMMFGEEEEEEDKDGFLERIFSSSLLLLFNSAFKNPAKELYFKSFLKFFVFSAEIWSSCLCVLFFFHHLASMLKFTQAFFDYVVGVHG